MSIEPIGSVDSNTTPLIELQQVFSLTQFEHREPQELPGLSSLTAGDREFLTALYGPQVLAIGNRAAERAAAPQLLLDLVTDRQDGRLPIGSEVTSTYVRARFDAHVDLNGTVTNPLTEKNLADALTYFSDRVQGAAIDLQA